MAKVSLRTYNREIETLIDRAHIEEAADHCKHILQAYPKHLETYRLLGKAFLESQRFGEAADIFERVLASIPDDFFSHVGMSIIREDENNLDRAIWHMERAFEAQPANTVVQNELRRLFTRRDGVEPPRIRLTRGALARMYARGDLYQQAIAELRSALAEDPNRVDLRVLLARMCFQSGQKVEATQICGDLLSKYPYTYEANRILAEILPGTSRAEDARVYRQRMVALDPYAGFTTLESPLPSDVADNAILLEQLDWSPSAAVHDTGQPQWATSLGISMANASAPAKIPDWIQSSDTADVKPPAMEPTAVPTTPAAAGDQPGIPDWLKEAGWAPAAPGSQEEPGPAFEESEEPAADGLVPAEIPSWLQAMAPANLPAEENEAARDKAFEDLFGSVGPAASPAQPAPRSAAPVSTGQDTMPAWLKDMETTAPADEPAAVFPGAAGGAAVTAAEPAQADHSLDWLNDLQSSAEAPAESALPDWLSPAEEPAASIQAAASEAADDGQTLPGFAAPGWLKEFSESAAPTAAPTAGSFAAPEPAAEELAPAELPDWLAGLGPAAVEIPAAAAPSASAPAQPSPVELPDWFSEFAAPAAVETPAQQPSLAEELAPADLPAWLAELEPTSPEIPAAAAAAGPVDSAELAAPAQVPAAFEEPAPVELPDWLAEIDAAAPQSEPASAAAAVPSPEPAAVPGLLPAAMPLSQSDEDAALAWLEGLAAKQGADEQVLFARPEDRAAEPPAWVQASQTEAVEASLPAEVPPSIEFPLPEEPSAVTAQELPEELPDWLKEIESPALEGGEGTPLALAAASPEDLPPTLIPEALAPVPVETEPAPVGLITEEIPDWLMEIETPQPQAVETPSTPVSLGEAPVEGALSQSEEDAALAWLEGLAAKQGADEQVLFVKPEDRAAEPPAWATVGQSQPADLETAPAPAAEPEALPDWLAAIETPFAEQPPAAETPSAEISAVEPIEGEPLPVGQLPADELPDWITDRKPAAVTSAESVETPLSQSEEDAALAWLEGLAAKQGADEQVLFVRPEDRTAEPPAWVQAEAAQPGEQEFAPAEEAPVAEIPAAVEIPSPVLEADGLPDWLAEIETPALTAAPAETAAAAAEPVTLAAEPAGISAPSGLVTEEIPAWLDEIEPPVAETPAEPSLSAPAAVETPLEAPLSQSEEDAALAWLEGLAAKQGADEQVLFVKPEERAAEPPAWVQASVEQAAAGPTEPPLPVEIPASETAPAAVTAEEVPDWLAEIEVTETAAKPADTLPTDVPSPTASTETGLEGWLQEIAAETTIRPPEQDATPTPASAEEVPTWLVEMEAAEAPTQVTSRAELNRAIADITAKNSAQAASETPAQPAAEEAALPVPAVKPAEPAAVAVLVTPLPAPTDPDAVLSTAQAALSEGQVEQAVNGYLTLISNGSLVDEVVHDLREALYHYPVDISIWQALGDALLRANRIQEALDAYTKAEDLLR
jgi:tetratricopeptide (TPR) repeat protein